MQPAKTIPAVFIILFGAFFLVPGLLLSGWYFHGFLQWREAATWAEVPCRIESAALKKNRGSDSTTYQVTASYRYQYQGRTYQSERVGFSSGSDNIGKFHQRAYRELAAYLPARAAKGEAEATGPPARRFRCYVNPDHPEEAVLYRELRWEKQAFLAIFALIFPAVGAGVVVSGLISFRRQRLERRLQAAHPDEPWRWKPEWAGTAIPDGTGKWRAVLYAYTLWATAVVVPLLAASWAGGAFAGGGSAYLLLIYPILWCVPAGLSLRRFRQRAAVGAAGLELKTLPAAPGAVLAGEVVLGRMVRMLAGAVASLVCERQVTRRQGNKTSIATETVWSEDQAVGADLILQDVGRCRIPVRFAIPRDAPASGPEPGRADAEMNWKLKVKAPGTAIDCAFELPVFRDPRAPVPEAAAVGEVASLRSARLASLPELLQAQRLVADFDGQGQLRTMVSPPARNRALIGFLLVFDLIWTGVAIVLVRQEAPLLFQIVWPVSAAVIWVVIGWQLLHRRTVTFGDGGVVVLNQLGPARWRLDLTRDRIAGFSFDSNMQSNNRNFYRIRVEDSAGKKHTLLSGISEVAAAEALVDHLTGGR